MKIKYHHFWKKSNFLKGLRADILTVWLLYTFWTGVSPFGLLLWQAIWHASDLVSFSLAHRHAKRRYCTVRPDAFNRNRRNFCVWACFIKNLNEAFSISRKSIFNSVGHLTFALAPTHVQNIYPKSLFVPRKVRKMFLTQIWVLPTTQQNSEFFTHYFRVYNLES